MTPLRHVPEDPLSYSKGGAACLVEAGRVAVEGKWDFTLLVMMLVLLLFLLPLFLRGAKLFEDFFAFLGEVFLFLCVCLV